MLFFQLLIYFLLKKYFFKGSIMPFFTKLLQFYFKFFLQEFPCIVCRYFKKFGYSRKFRFCPFITQAFGEIEISQSVNAYNASMVISGEIPGARSMLISTSAAVLSVTFFILIFPLSFALMMLSISWVVVVPYGTSFINKVFLSNCSIRALTLTLPPRTPSL